MSAVGYATNRVWDSVAGAEVRWVTFRPDPTGAFYPGPGTFGVTTSQYTLEAIDARETLAPRVELLSGLTSGNFYEGGAGDLPGSANGFLASALIVEQRGINGIGQTIWGNISSGPARGWRLAIESDSRREVNYGDTSGAVVGASGGAFIATSDSTAAMAAGKINLLLLRYLPDNSLELWSNGSRVARTTNADPISPATDNLRVGAGWFGTDAQLIDVAGVGYLAGTLTDDQVRQYSYDCLQALDVIAPPSAGWIHYSVRRGNPGATWAPSDGAGPTLNRNGAPTRLSFPIGRLGV